MSCPLFPLVIGIHIGKQNDGAVDKRTCLVWCQVAFPSRSQPCVLGIDQRAQQGTLLRLYDRHHIIYRVAVEDVLAEEALTQDKVIGQPTRLNEFGVNPTDGMAVLYPMSCSRIILHDFAGTGIAVEVQLPIDDAFVFRGADKITALQPFQVFLADMALGVQKAEEVVLATERVDHIVEGNVHRFYVVIMPVHHSLSFRGSAFSRAVPLG